MVSIFPTRAARSSFVPRTLPAAMPSTRIMDQVASSDVPNTVMKLRKSVGPQVQGAVYAASPGTNYRRWLSLRLFRQTFHSIPQIASKRKTDQSTFVTLHTASSLARNQKAHAVRWSMVLCQEAIGGLISTSTL